MFFTILFKILIFIVWLVSITAVVLGGIWVLQVGLREVLGVDIFIRQREKLQEKFAPRSEKAFYGTDDMFYISVPRKLIETAGNVNTENFEQRGNVEI